MEERKKETKNIKLNEIYNGSCQRKKEITKGDALKKECLKEYIKKKKVVVVVG